MLRKSKLILSAVTLVLVYLLSGLSAWSAPPADPQPPGTFQYQQGRKWRGLGKDIDRPNLIDALRIRERQRLQKFLRRPDISAQSTLAVQEQLRALSLTGQDRVLVILVQFGGPDAFTYTPGVSTWDPIGLTNSNEWAGSAGNCSNIDSMYGISGATSFSYQGPLHNTIPRPLSAADRSGESIWTEDFSKEWFEAFMFGNGVIFDYDRVDGSPVYEDLTGKSVRDYYEDMSGGQYSITGDVYGWVTVDHSSYWYGADTCPGRRSYSDGAVYHNGAIPGAGSAKTLVTDAIEKVKLAYPSVDWTVYDQNGDGLIDRLWIVHAGYGEEDSPTLLNRDAVKTGLHPTINSGYGEGFLWSHSSSLSTPYPVGPGISAQAYIMMPENGGIAVFAHESGHNIGADDLYSYGGGETSAGFWTLMADDWTGYPLGYQPPALDPWHLDNWGWLSPQEITDPGQVYTATIGQASDFPGTAGMVRGVRIGLENGQAPLAVMPVGAYDWWGAKGLLSNASMTTVNAISIPAAATLQFDLAYDIESGYDFLWVQLSSDGGMSWHTLTNANTTCNHAGDWIGGFYHLPSDLCGAGIGGFSGTDPSFPSFISQSFNLAAFSGQSVLLRFWYMTDYSLLGEGPFVDNIVISAGGSTVFSDNAEQGDSLWTYDDGWARNAGYEVYDHNYYLQWRNVAADGGYDSSLGDSRFRYGPANTGLLVWYNNNRFSDNEIFDHINFYPNFGPQGRMLVLDAHPEPYRDPSSTYFNEVANLTSRSQMRDAPFSSLPSVDFIFGAQSYLGRSAVSSFYDGNGLYPGVEYVRSQIGYAYNWYTSAWDSSAVMPAKSAYSIKSGQDTLGALYQGSSRLRFNCVAAGGGGALCYSFNSGIGIDGGSGNPSEGNLQYGWHVAVVSQTAQSGVVRIWNDAFDPAAAGASAGVPMRIDVAKSGAGEGTVASSPAQRISCGSTCSGYFANGSAVTLSAQGGATGHFDGWGGACSGTGDCALTMDSDKQVSAAFSPCYQLNAGVSPAGGGSVAVSTPANCNGTLYLAGTVVQLSATPASQYTFSSWSGASGTAESASVTMDSDKTITANFGSVCYGVKASAKPKKGGKVKILTAANCPGESNKYLSGTQVKIKATPNKKSGYRLFKWQGGDPAPKSKKKAKVKTTLAIVVNSERNVKAVFGK